MGPYAMTLPRHGTLQARAIAKIPPCSAQNAAADDRGFRRHRPLLRMFLHEYHSRFAHFAQFLPQPVREAGHLRLFACDVKSHSESGWPMKKLTAC
jgi:hypothetical protein